MQYRTHDLNIAALLMAEGFIIQDMLFNSKQRALFIFNDNEELQKIIKGYWDDTIKVSPQKIFSSLKNIKTRLYNR